MPGDAAERGQAAASQNFLKTHPWLAKIAGRPSTRIGKWFIVAILLIWPWLRSTDFARFDLVANFLTHGSLVTITAMGGLCFLAWLVFRERSQRAEREHELALLRLLFDMSTQAASMPASHGSAQFPFPVRLVEILLTRRPRLEYETHRREPALNFGDSTVQPASEEDDRAMPDAPRQEDAPGSERPPSSGVL